MRFLRSFSTAKPPSLIPKDVPGYSKKPSPFSLDFQLAFHVYKTMRSKLTQDKAYQDNIDRLSMNQAPLDLIETLERTRNALQSGFEFPILKRTFDSGENIEIPEHLKEKHEYSELLKRLIKDGGDKIIISNFNVLHIKYFRFFKVIEEVKGLNLNDALVQLRFHKGYVGQKYSKMLAEMIVQAKESGFDLQSTFIAETRAIEKAAIFSKELMKNYIRGRGRYGATMHPLTCRVDFVLQERDRPFPGKVNDPIEYIRSRIRETQREYSQTAEQVYDEVRANRLVKKVYC